MNIQHQWIAFTMGPVELIDDPEYGPRVFDCLDPEVEAVTTYGCATCNVGIQEGRSTPCPGFDPLELEQKP